jgi:hypothetical protein
MTHPKKQIILTVIATILFYAVGRLAYEYFYRWTIQLVKYFSKGTLSFFGKYPFWFFGDPIFGLIFCSIPISFYLTFLILRKKTRTAFKWTASIYLIVFISFYFLSCYGQSFQLVASNDFYKTGQTLQYNLRQVNLNQIYLNTIIMTTVVTIVVNLIRRYFVTRNASLQSSRRPHRR